MIYVFLAKGFEEIEAITVIDILRRAGLEVKSVSISDEFQTEGSHGITVTADITVKETDLDKAVALVFPGGMPGTVNLDESKDVDRIIAEGHKRGILLAAVCAAPMILGKRGLLKGKKAICYPGFEKYLEGAEIATEKAVISGRIVTSKGPGTAPDFSFAILEALGMKEKADTLKKGMQYV
jgi:4-methyl-5(b-hydroxyethyl)-thiazole monophosphate biosynthesis